MNIVIQLIAFVSSFLSYVTLSFFLTEFITGALPQVILEIITLLIPFGISEANNRYNKYFITYVLMQIGIPVIAGLITFRMGLLSYPSFAVICIISIFGFYQRMSKEKGNFELSGYLKTAFVIVLYFFSCIEKVDQVRELLIYVVFAELLMTIFGSNIIAGNQFIQDREHASVMSSGRMRQINVWLTSGYIGILGLCMLVVSKLSFTKLRKVIGDMLIWIIKAIVGLFQITEPLEEPMQSVVEQQGMMPIPEPNEPSLILIIIEKILFFFVTVAIIAGILYVLVRMVRFLYQRFQMKTENDYIEEQEFLFPLQHRRLSKKNKNPRKERHFLKTPQEKIRAYYKKRLQGFWGNESSIPIYLTPTQQCDKGKEQGQDIPENVKQLYELARYSNEPLEKKDVLKMRNLITHKR